MKSQGIALSVAVLAAFCVPFLPAQIPEEASFPSLDPDPMALEFSLRGGNGYSWQDLAEIALWASGAGRSPIGNTVKEQIAAAVRELTAKPDLPSGLKERGEYILRFMYERFLRSYSAYQTRLDEVFISGRYNCVSSAVLYTILASAVGLEVQGMMTRDHAFVTLKAGPERIDVETTTPLGFDPGNRREFHDAFGRTTGFVYIPARNYQERAAISPLELVSLIFTNRIAEMERQSRYGEAVPLAADRAALLSNRKTPVLSPFFTDPQKDILDRIYNYGASLLNSGKENEALIWGAIAEERYPDKRYPEFLYACLNNQFVKLLKAKRIGEARSILGQYRSGLGAEQAGRLDGLILEMDLTERLGQIKGSGDAETALDLIDNASPLALQSTRAAEMRNFIILKEGERLAMAEGARRAIAYIEWGIARYGRNTRLDEGLRVHRTNRVAELHNHFAELFNGRDYESAWKVVLAGLEEFPSNRQLQSDLNLAEKSLRSR